MTIGLLWEYHRQRCYVKDHSGNEVREGIQIWIGVEWTQVQEDLLVP
jgi:hypothetical protein